MENYKKALFYVAAVIANAAFFTLCDYGKVQHPDTASYLDSFLGIIAVVALSAGVARVGVQIYYRSKYKYLRCRFFDMKFWRQCTALLVYYLGSLAYLWASVSVYKASYLSVFALILCPLWLTGGSRTLWAGDEGEESYYLDETTKWYEVRNVMENDDVVEITCKAPGDRERTISIAKKKQKLDQ